MSDKVTIIAASEVYFCVICLPTSYDEFDLTVQTGVTCLIRLLLLPHLRSIFRHLFAHIIRWIWPDCPNWSNKLFRVTKLFYSEALSWLLSIKMSMSKYSVFVMTNHKFLLIVKFTVTLKIFRSILKHYELFISTDSFSNISPISPQCVLLHHLSNYERLKSFHWTAAPGPVF